MPSLRTAVLFLTLSLAAPSFAAIYEVDSLADSGPGTLRQAILEANSGACNSCTIRLAFPQPRYGAPLPRINLLSPLPALTAPQARIAPFEREGQTDYFGSTVVEVNGAQAGPDADGFRARNASGVFLAGVAFVSFSRHGVDIRNSTGLRLRAEGHDNGGNGLLLVETSGRASGFFSGNGGNGVYVGRSANLEMSGLVGYRNDSYLPRGNRGNGVHLHDVQNVSFNFGRIGYNAHSGILITGNSSKVNLGANTFESNGLLAIDHGADGPSVADAPMIESATWNRGYVRVRGTIRSRPNSVVYISFYQTATPDPSGYGEGSIHLFPDYGSRYQNLKTDENGFVTFEATFHDFYRSPRLRRSYVTALATVSPTGFGTPDTSEFGRTVQIVDDEITYFVTTTADSGAGSLRRAIEDSNNGECVSTYPCEIHFNIPTLPDSRGVLTIQPRTPLPAMSREAVTLYGRSQREFAGDTNPAGPEIELNGALCARCSGFEVRGTPGRHVFGIAVTDLVINGFDGDGFVATGAEGGTLNAVLIGSYIGTDPTAAQIVANGGSGVRVDGATLSVNGSFRLINDRPEPGYNVISGNRGDGIRVDRGMARSDSNRIGTDLSGVMALPNERHGVFVRESAAGVYSSIVAFNRGTGILSTGGAVAIGSQIHSNGGLGIDFRGDGVTENGPGAQQNAPEIRSAVAEGDNTRITFTLDSPPPGREHEYLVELFASSFVDASGRGEGRTRVASVITSGRAGEVVTELVRQNLAGKYISGTATRYNPIVFTAGGATSEFSRSVQAISGGCPDAVPVLVEQSGNRFRWSAAAGANAYRIWVMKPGELPRIVFEGTALEAQIDLPTGTYEWWVEARFDPCYGTQSEHRSAVVE